MHAFVRREGIVAVGMVRIPVHTAQAMRPIQEYWPAVKQSIAKPLPSSDPRRRRGCHRRRPQCSSSLTHGIGYHGAIIVSGEHPRANRDNSHPNAMQVRRHSVSVSMNPLSESAECGVSSCSQLISEAAAAAAAAARARPNRHHQWKTVNNPLLKWREWCQCAGILAPKSNTLSSLWCISPANERICHFHFHWQTIAHSSLLLATYNMSVNALRQVATCPFALLCLPMKHTHFAHSVYFNFARDFVALPSKERYGLLQLKTADAEHGRYCN